jgi:uncharacterized protein (DUF924 family)
MICQLAALLGDAAAEHGATASFNLTFHFENAVSKFGRIDQRNQILDRFRRPDDLHFVDRLGAGRSRLPRQELTHPLT